MNREKIMIAGHRRDHYPVLAVLCAATVPTVLLSRLAVSTGWEPATADDRNIIV